MAREVVRKDGSTGASHGRGRTEEEWAIDTEIGRRARKRRKIMGFTLAQVAERIGLTFQVIQKLENGEVALTVARMIQLATALEMPPEDLMRGLKIEPSQKEPDRAE